MIAMVYSVHAYRYYIFEQNFGPFSEIFFAWKMVFISILKCFI